MADFFRDVERAINSAVDDVSGKVNGMSAVAGLKSQIRTCEDVISRNYYEIGRMYYEMYGSNPGPEMAKQCEAITNAKRAIADKEREIQATQGR